MLSTSVLSFSNKLPLSSRVINGNGEEDGETEDLLSGYRSMESGIGRNSRQQQKQQISLDNQRFSEHLCYRSPYSHHRHRHHHRRGVGGETSSLSSDSLGSTLTSVRVKYLGAIRASGRTAILSKGITAIQPELLDLYTIAQRKFVATLSSTSSANQTSSSSSSSASATSSSNYQIIEICNYGVVIAEPDPSAATTLSVVGGPNLTNPNRIVVTKVITPLSNIVLWAGVRYNCRPLKVRGRHRLGAAFIPLSCSSAVLKTSSYTPLTTNRSRFLSSLSHPPLFLCVLRKVSSPKTFECHLFACCTVEDAINLSSNLSDVQNGILKVGNPSIPLQSDCIPSYSYSTFDEVDGHSSRTPSRQLSSSTILVDRRHIVGTESPSLLTDRASRLTVTTEEPITRNSGFIHSLTNNNGSSPRREMYNYRREIGLRPWPSSAGIKLLSNGKTQSGLSSSSDLSKAVSHSNNSVSKSEQLSTSSQYSMCQACLSNGQQLKGQLDSHNRPHSEHVKQVHKKDYNMNYNSKDFNNSPNDKSSLPPKSNHTEINNYNGYVVQFKYNESINQQTNNHRNKNSHTHKIDGNHHSTGDDQLTTTTTVPNNKCEDHNLSKLGRRGQRLATTTTTTTASNANNNNNNNNNNNKINGRGNKMKNNNCPSSTSSHNNSHHTATINNDDSDQSYRTHSDISHRAKRYPKSTYNRFNHIIIEDDNLTDLTSDSAFPSSDLIEGDGLLTFVEDDLRENSFYPPMIKVNNPSSITNNHHHHLHHRRPHHRWPLESSSAINHLTLYPHSYRPEIPPRVSSASLFRRLGRWKLRSWVRKSFNLKFRLKKKRSKVDLFADRDLRYLSLAEPLDYIGDRKLGLSNRLQLADQSGDQTKGYFLGMESTVNENYSSSKVMGTQELPEERTGLENLKQLIEERKNQSNCQVDSLLIVNSNGTKKGKKPMTDKTNGDQSLSKIDLLNELGYLP